MADGISYKNKDVLFKVLSEAYKEKSFAVYGINLPKIKEVLPTNLPKISADEKSIDNLFLLEDDTFVIVDYESTYKHLNKIKYLNYAARVIEKYFTDINLSIYSALNNRYKDIKLRIIVIYTGDVEKAEPVLETGCITLRTEQAFLINIDGKSEYQAIKEKIESNQSLAGDDVMKLIILPLTQKGKESKHDMLEKVVEVSKKIPDEKLQVMILSGVLVASDKFVDDEYSERVRRFLSMTKIERIFEKEKIEYANEQLKKATLANAKIMLDEGIDIIKIMKITGLMEQEILSLQDKVML